MSSTIISIFLIFCMTFALNQCIYDGMDIDLVYTWVNMTDTVWRENYRVHMPSKFDVNRFKDNNELKYSLRSVEMYAPFFRKIYIVVDH